MKGEIRTRVVMRGVQGKDGGRGGFDKEEGKEDQSDLVGVRERLVIRWVEKETD